MDEVLNVGFFVFHSAWIVFNAVGWMFRRLRRWHLATIALTALSWLGLGLWYGVGYCPLTDWHWQVRARLGYHDPDSYMQLLIADVLRVNLSSRQADTLTGSLFAVVGGLSIILNLRDVLRERRVGTP